MANEDELPPLLFEDDGRNELSPVQREALDLLGMAEEDFWGSFVTQQCD